MVIRYIALLPLLIGFVGPTYTAAEHPEPDTLFDQSIEAMRLAEYDQANVYIEDALRLFEEQGDSAGIARAYGYFSSSYRLMENEEQARHYGKKSSELAERLGDPTLSIRANNNLGIMERVAGNYQQALNYYERAREGTEEAGEYEFMASITMNIGIVNRNLDLYEDAADAYNEGLELAKKHDLPDRKSSAYSNMALLYTHTGNYRQAIDLYLKSHELLEQTGTRSRKPNNYNDIGLNYRYLGEYDKALSYYGKGLSLARELDQTTNVVNIQNNLAQVYLTLDNSERAFHYFQANLEYLDDITDKAVHNSVLSNMGRGYYHLEQFDDALSFYHRALSSSKNLSQAVQSSRYYDLANFHQSQSEPDSSYYYASLALEAARETGALQNIVSTKRSMAEMLYDMGEAEAALDYAEKIAEYADAYDVPQFSVDYSVALMNTTQPNDNRYFEAAELFMDAIEQQRRHIQVSADLRSSFFSDYAPRYKQIAKAYLDQNKIDDAFEIIERTRARVLIEETEQAIREDTYEESDYLELQGMRNQISDLYEELETEASSSDRDSLQQVLGELKTEKETFRASAIDDQDIESTITPMTLDELGDYIGDETAVLSYAETNDHILAIAYLDGNHKSWKIDKSGEYDFNELLERFRSAITDERPIPVINRFGWVLARELLQPAENFIQSADHIIVSAGGNLATLPFEALTWNGNYLINEVTVSTIPSLSTLKLQQLHPASEYSKDLFAVANPDFEPQDIDDALALRDIPRASPGRLDPLPATQIEAEQISELFSNTSLISREDANRYNVVNTDFSSFRFVHFATHGFIHREFPEMSGLALSHGDGSVEYLRSREISTLNIPADMVVLSACETAVGPHVTGEGMLGLQRAFLIAGSQSVVASLWRVYDQSTSKLMSDFYANILSSELQINTGSLFSFGQSENEYLTTIDKANAMRSAKIKMINSSEFHHPVHWAAFTITGY